jgi:histidyl-tRNA synthetase
LCFADIFLFLYAGNVSFYERARIMQFQIPKGVFDILPYGADEPWRLTYLWQEIESLIRSVTRSYGFQEIRTPIFEKTELFLRGFGETTDVVSKEMYTFEDKAGRSMTLRPEGTASVMRAFVEKKLYTHSSLHKLYYVGPMFRYERPQAGRYRQHHQFGVEAIGTCSYELDVEVIDLLSELYRRLGIQNTTLYVNSLGDVESRERYKKALQDFLLPNLPQLSKESQERFEKNPLRILDTKDLKDRELIAQAPRLLDYLSEDSKAHFQGVCHLLEKIKIPYKINEKLVRGFDYYTNTVFEITCGSLGAQNSLGGGGRYDTLISSFGGPQLPGVGFGTGIERILETLLQQKIPPQEPPSFFVFFIPLGKEAEELCFSYATHLRHAGIPTESEFATKKIQKSLQRANKLKVRYVVIVGEEEIKKQKVAWKDLQTHEQKEVALEDLDFFIKKIWKEEEKIYV